MSNFLPDNCRMEAPGDVISAKSDVVGSLNEIEETFGKDDDSTLGALRQGGDQANPVLSSELSKLTVECRGRADKQHGESGFNPIKCSRSARNKVHESIHYKEILLKVEDDHFKMDVLVGKFETAISHAEEFLAECKDKSTAVEAKKYITERDARVIEWLYSDYGEAIMGLLWENPGVIVNSILPKLKKKLEELMECRSNMCSTWSQVCKEYEPKLHSHGGVRSNNVEKKVSLRDWMESHRKKRKRNVNKYNLCIVDGQFKII